MNMNKYLDIAPEVQQALADGRPVVALESTIISHGMPYPKNVETALLVEQTLRDNGAVPATIAILGGRLKAGLSKEEITYLGKAGRKVAKVSRRDLPVICARGADGATTVTTTMMIAHMAGIQVFATGGIGGVHRGAETTMDISADLEELAQTPVMVVCAGAKAILDLGLTLEYLETKGVPVLGYGTDELPAFYTRESGLGVDARVDTPEDLAAIFQAQRDLGLKTGMLVTNPIPQQYAMDKTVIDKCTGCADRVAHGMAPACVSACQPNALQFGDRDEMIAKGKEKVAWLHENGYPDACLYGEHEMGGLHVIQVLKYGIDAHNQVQDPKAPVTAQLTQIMKPVTGAISGLTVVGLAAMFGLAIGYKRDKLAYNPETEDTVSVITGDVVQHGDPQDDKTVMEHITENLPIGKKGDK